MNAVVLATTPHALTLQFDPSMQNAPPAGRFFLACAESGGALNRPWDLLLRRPLFPTQLRTASAGLQITFDLPATADAGYAWLRARQPGDALDLLGPFGNGFTIAPQSRTLLLVADAYTAPLLLPLIDDMLDRAGRVTLLLRQSDPDNAHTADLLATLPFAVEARVESAATFAAALAELTPWADQIALYLPYNDYAQAAQVVRTNRMRPLPRFAQALVVNDLACGIGACLACIVPLARGSHTRACINGPVFDLLELF